MPSLPRGRRCPQRPVISRPPACRIATASPCHPGLRPAPGRICDEASARVHCHSPHTSLPLACEPGRNGFPGLFPGLRTPPGRTRQRTPGRGQARTLPGLRPWHQPASLRRTHSQRATSRRTNSQTCAARESRTRVCRSAPIGGSASVLPDFPVTQHAVDRRSRKPTSDRSEVSDLLEVTVGRSPRCLPAWRRARRAPTSCPIGRAICGYDRVFAYVRRRPAGLAAAGTRLLPKSFTRLRAPG
jgi:hypothetical protein